MFVSRDALDDSDAMRLAAATEPHIMEAWLQRLNEVDVAGHRWHLIESVIIILLEARRKGVGTGAPKKSKFAQNCGFWAPEADTVNTFR